MGGLADCPISEQSIGVLYFIRTSRAAGLASPPCGSRPRGEVAKDWKRAGSRTVTSLYLYFRSSVTLWLALCVG